MTQSRKHRNARNAQSGVALIAALITLLLIGAITAGMIILSTTETNTSANFRDAQTAYFASRAGLAEVRDRMRKGAPDTIFANLPTNLPGNPQGILYMTNPLPGETVTPWNLTGNNYPDDEICTEVSCPSGTPNGGASWYVHNAGTAGSSSTIYAATPQLSWKWVRLMAKVNRSDLTTRTVSVDGASGTGQPTFGQRVCWDTVNNHEAVTTAATCQTGNPNYEPIYELTSLAVTPSGSRRVAQYELAEVSLPVFPGAMIFDSPAPNFSDPNSNAFVVSGVDANQGPNAGAGCGAPINQPAIGAYNNAAATTINAGLIRPASYQSNTPYPTTNAVSNVNSQMGTLATVDGIANLENMVITAAQSNVYIPPAGPTNLGTNANPVINVIQGDYTLGPVSGAGILLVTGTLTFNGAFNYNGLILVIGKGVVSKTGGGGGVLNGSMFLANMYTDLTYTTPIALGSNLPPGPTTIMSWSGGGNATFQYDSCWLNQLGVVLPFKLVTSREMIY